MPTVSPPANQADGNKCLVQAGAVCRAEELQAQGDLHVWARGELGLRGRIAHRPLVHLPRYLGTGIFCCFPLKKQDQNPVQTCQEGRLDCGEVGVLQEPAGPSEGTLQSGDTAQDKMPENQSQ